MHRFGLPLGLCALSQLPGALTKVQQTHDLPSQHGEGLFLFLAHVARMAIEDAEGADRLAVRGEKRDPGVEPDERVACHHGMVGESEIGQGIGDYDWVRLHDGMRAEGAIPLYLGVGDSDRGFEPQPGAIHETDIGHGGAANLGGKVEKIVEGWLGVGVQNASTEQGFVPSVLVLRLRGGLRHVQWHPELESITRFDTRCSLEKGGSPERRPVPRLRLSFSENSYAILSGWWTERPPFSSCVIDRMMRLDRQSRLGGLLEF